MSLGTWLKKEEADIAFQIENLGPELKNVILPVAIEVTNVLKELEDFDSMDIVGRIIAGTAGAAIEDKVRSALDTIVPDLQMAQTYLGSGNVNTILAGVLQLVKASSTNVQAAFWVEFSGKLAQFLQGSVSIAQAISLAQWFYANYPKTTATAPVAPATPTA